MASQDLLPFIIQESITSSCTDSLQASEDYSQALLLPWIKVSAKTYKHNCKIYMQFAGVFHISVAQSEKLMNRAERKVILFLQIARSIDFFGRRRRRPCPPPPKKKYYIIKTDNRFNSYQDQHLKPRKQPGTGSELNSEERRRYCTLL